MMLGFVGTGTLSSAVVSGLVGVHGAAHDIVVSPRSEETSRRLATQHDNVRRAGSNDDVVAASDIVFIGVRPQHLDAALGDLTFKPHQTVVSFVAGADIERIEGLCRPAGRIVRVTPLPMIANRKGPIVIYPEAPDVEALFSGLGTVIVAESARQVATLGCAGGLMATYFEMALTAVSWMEGESVPKATGRDYLLSMFEALSLVGLATPPEELEALPAAYSTPGGINERCRAFLCAEDWFETYDRGLSDMKRHLERLVDG